MSRTNIDLDDKLVETVMRRYRFETKRSAVEFALTQLVSEPMTLDEALAMRGSGVEFDNDEVESQWAAPA